MDLRKILVGVAGYVAIVFPLAYIWHLVAFQSVYDQLGYFGGRDPILALGVLAILIQGFVLSIAYPLVRIDGHWLRRGLVFGLLAGLFLGSSQIIAAAAKQQIEPLSLWFTIEWAYFAIQFALAGAWFGWLFQDDAKNGAER